MADYWKSIPKYYCKYCQIFVKDTPFARRSHEQTYKHQDAIKKVMDDIHRSNLLRQELEKNLSIPKSATATTASAVSSELASYEKPKKEHPKLRPSKKKATLDDWDIPTSSTETDTISTTHTSYIPTLLAKQEENEETKETTTNKNESLPGTSLKRNREIIEKEERSSFHFRVKPKNLDKVPKLAENEGNKSLESKESNENKVVFKKKKSGKLRTKSSLKEYDQS
ncbi:U2-type precatalytic spliceosome WW domain-binding protein Wbp4 [Schizosaccharomyces pombe]|uniref:Uncharacterized protein C18H10.07 n=1 Tax=Schizosaccharomyces pombe (strain 972 / ATCC 24843) TaxID=284812 RepID=YNS7_SCHPO|nr:putative WW domain-binding protein 4 [Schizosaccharomyces pombe]O60138.1 RecName: Full=Uncharacterized protein C18H10.07 [Schizosaccharomyces pombe 972h-]CAA18404.1 WW domain-binding protein 4 (predicted) [Schizosaccharomyces pombe]|eukprot:NP_595731.1 putative WW domain-binding protein 4 [Schizosaccharomyces pombe]